VAGITVKSGQQLFMWQEEHLIRSATIHVAGITVKSGQQLFMWQEERLNQVSNYSCGRKNILIRSATIHVAGRTFIQVSNY
jgi:hypothetical protein